MCSHEQEVKVGDKVPDISLDVYRSGRPSIGRLYGIKSDLILLDFWGVDCGACVTAMPRMLELQRRFGDRIKILLVTSDSERDINKLFLRLKRYKTLPHDLIDAFDSLTFIVNDSFFLKRFPHKVIPAHVWIGRDYTFKALAYQNSTNDSSIGAFLDNRAVNWALVKSGTKDFNDPFQNIQMLVNDSFGKAAYSILTSHQDFGRSGNWYVNTVAAPGSNLPIGVTAVNAGIIRLYEFVFQDSIKDMDDARVLVEASDTYRFYAPNPIGPDRPSWDDSNTYCYTMKISERSSVDYKSIMHQDLDRFLGLSSRIEYRNIKCFILRPINDAHSIGEMGTNDFQRHILDSLISFSDVREFHGSYELFSLLRSCFEIQFPSEPFFYMGQFDKNRKGILPWNFEAQNISKQKLLKALQIQGFKLVEDYINIPMVVIRNGVMPS